MLHHCQVSGWLRVAVDAVLVPRTADSVVEHWLAGLSTTSCDRRSLPAQPRRNPCRALRLGAGRHRFILCPLAVPHYRDGDELGARAV